MHLPVLERELIEILNPCPGDNFIDCTLGEGGHAGKILEMTRGKKTKKGGFLLGIELDKRLYVLAGKKLSHFKKRAILVNDNYCHLNSIKRSYCPTLSFKGIYFDLGVCFWHYQYSKSGFSFQGNELLDMRFNKRNQLKAADILKDYTQSELIKVFKTYGEISFANRLASQIVRERKKKLFDTTQDLVKVILKVMPSGLNKKRKAVLSKVFQALRIEVNQELDNLKITLNQVPKIMDVGGILAVISYHSLEDRIVKDFLKHNNNFDIITKKPLQPTYLEQRFNPSARSAKLRVARLKK
jgi:16S rRNA (cytosine1402-N4)-methyltransferase